jgi:hypothetical protein
VKGPAWYTADRSQLVPDGDPRSAFLAAGPGDDVPTDVPWADDEVVEPVDVKPIATPTKKPVRKRTAKPKG